MKMKKTSAAATFVAVILTVLVTTAFGTSAAGGRRTERDLPDTDFSQEEYDMLLALQFEGYEDMSVTEYQNRVWRMTDTEEYRDLLERFSKDDVLYQIKDSDETAYFLFYLLDPLTAERWQTREFGGYTVSDHPEANDNAILEFSLTLTIRNADTLTIREYDEARLGVTGGLREILQDKTEGQLQNDAFMQEEIQEEIEALTKQWGSDKLQISVEYSYMPLSETNVEDMREMQENGRYPSDRKDIQEIQESGRYSSDGEDMREEQKEQDEQENRKYPNATEEDYRSLLSLKTSDYQNRSVAEFNRDLLAWANEDHERMERINGDTGYNDFKVDLSDEERLFVTQSVWLSGAENGEYVRSNYTGREEEDPLYNQYLPSKTAENRGRAAWCDLFYQLSYHIPDKEALTVGERDRHVSDMIEGVQHFWEETDIEQMLNMTEADILEEIEAIAAACSNDRIVITVDGDSVHFEKMDERNPEFN